MADCLKLLIATALLLVGTTVRAHDFDAPLRALAEQEIRAIVADPIVVAAIKAQNERTTSLSEQEVQALDQAWRSQIGQAAPPLIDAVLGSDAGTLLRVRREQSAGLYSAIMVMDAAGLNVAVSDTTAQYWQGGEAYWQLTFPVGPEAVHISEIQLEPTTRTYQSWVSIVVTDPETQKPIGAARFSVNVELLH